MEITTTMYAYIDRHSRISPEELQTEEGIKRLSIVSSNGSYWADNGYTYVGRATLTVEVPDLRTLVDNKVAALRAEAVAIRADATKKCTEIDGLIQNLLAIEYTPATEQQS